jgi:ABC-type Fe3+-hydroxamate transport system substrate-binding protein
VRVVSLVPSLTEAVAVTAPEVLAGATDYCTHPAGLDVPRVGGSKYPALEKVLAIGPDLVLMNEEENRREDAEALRAAGVEVFVTFPRTVDEAFRDLRRLFAALSREVPEWLVEAEGAWAGLRTPASRTVLVPVWRRPWIVLGGHTFAGDVLRRLGLSNVYGEAEERYPRPPLAELQSAGADLVVLPDEPYAFTADDGPEAFPGIPSALVSGRHLTWYGPSLAEAPSLLREQLEVTL